jgi:two-component system chemotaxis response regulator CheB
MHDPRGGFKVSVQTESQYNNHAPSVDITMLSAADILKANGIGVILTGMGADGAKGLKAMRNAGARCLAQNEATSVVFGMPAEAFKIGGAERLLPIGEMAKALSDIIASVK